MDNDSGWTIAFLVIGILFIVIGQFTEPAIYAGILFLALGWLNHVLRD